MIRKLIKILAGRTSLVTWGQARCDEMKISREQVKLVNFITATRRTDKKEFNGKRYIKIENDQNSEE